MLFNFIHLFVQALNQFGYILIICKAHSIQVLFSMFFHKHTHPLSILYIHIHVHVFVAFLMTCKHTFLFLCFNVLHIIVTFLYDIWSIQIIKYFLR